MEEVLIEFKGLITTDNIALLSVIITALIFIFSRRSEMQYKKHDDKKAQYIKLIILLEEIFMNTNKSSGSKEKNRPIQLTDEMKKQFFDVGSSLLLYGSKRLYKQYLFFRDFSNNPLIKQCKYYKQDLLLYVMADILITIRKEVGLNFFNTIKENEALGFFVNDLLNNPINKEKAINSKLCIKLVKFELYIIEQTRFTIFKKIYLLLFKPIIGLVSILIKFFIVIPFGRLILKLFPNFSQKISAKKESENK